MTNPGVSMGTRNDTRKVPQDVRAAVRRASKSLAASIRVVGRPNRAKDQPIPEQNLVLHLGSALLARGYSVYGEADLPRAGRIDLLACNDGHGLIVEAATFGSINMAKLLNDARRLERFRPQGPWKLLSRQPANAFWKCLDERWAMIMVLCFAWKHLTVCWSNLLDTERLDQALTAREVRDIRAFGTGRREDMRQLGKFLRGRGAELGVAPVLDQDLWRDVMPLWLLWAAWPLK